jgi:hypothetical protein
MKSESSLPRLQEPATRLCPKPDQSNPRPLKCFLKISVNVIYLPLGLLSDLFPSCFPPKPYSQVSSLL